PKGLFATGSLACDLMYARSASAWMIAAHHAGAAQIRDGLGMLIEQAAESFFVWHQIRPQTAPLLVQFAKELPCRDENGGWIPEEG
ncbi:MAG: hypothetical protein KGL58_07600, partial [Pseudomonadota bacterium]|nr:hypothetical protein [Pseudomonadota bacterium]